MNPRQHTTLAQIAAGFGISVGTAHTSVRSVVALLARRAPGLTQALREVPARAQFVLVDGTLAECDRIGDGRGHSSGKHRRHGVNLQVITDPMGRILWISRVLPGRAHDLTTARKHGVISTCGRLGIPVLADLGHLGTGSTLATRRRRPPSKKLTPGPKSPNQAHARLRNPIERGMAPLNTWRIFHNARCNPTWLTTATRAVLTPESYR